LPYRVRLTRRAELALLKLPADRRKQLLRRMTRLQSNPYPHGKAIKRLEVRTPAGEPLYRLRSGDYRIVYLVREAEVIVLAVVHRRDLERALAQLIGGS